MKKDIIDFLYQSINDTQSTIRALDTKIGFLFVITFIPITKLKETINSLLAAQTLSPCHTLLIAIMVIFWSISFVSIFLGLTPRVNKLEQNTDNTPNGSFYSIKIYEPSSINESIKKLPKNQDEIIEELSFERLKLGKIRRIKIKMIKICIHATFSWIVAAY
jgi:hypothetical protein